MQLRMRQPLIVFQVSLQFVEPPSRTVHGFEIEISYDRNRYVLIAMFPYSFDGFFCFFDLGLNYVGTSKGFFSGNHNHNPQFPEGWR